MHGCCFSIGHFSRSFPFRVTYEEVLYEVEQADEQAKKIKRAPRSYEQSDKKLKTTKIVTKKGDLTAEKNKNKKNKPKRMAASNKSIETAVQDENELEEEEEEDDDETEEENLVQEKNIVETKEQPMTNDDENESMPIDDVQQPTLSVAEKLQALGKKPAPFSKTTAKYENEMIALTFFDANFFCV